MRGEFILYPDTSDEIIVPNRILDEGAEALLDTIFEGANPLGSNFYLGLMGLAYDLTDGLVDITEPTHNTNGYARAQLTRNATDWPSIAKVNGVWRAMSKQVTFTASGGSFDETVQRMFLCNAASGTTGVLFSVSGSFPEAKTLTDGQSLPVKYVFWER